MFFVKNLILVCLAFVAAACSEPAKLKSGLVPEAAMTTVKLFSPPPDVPASCPKDMVLVEQTPYTWHRFECLEKKKGEPGVCVRWRKIQLREPEIGMPVRICMDRYEYQDAITRLPKVMVTGGEAQALCSKQGKRLCFEQEWRAACMGPSRNPVPYGGLVRDGSKCNSDKAWHKPDNAKLFGKDEAVSEEEVRRLIHREPPGVRPECVSEFGVHDIVGNVDEFTINGGRTDKSGKSIGTFVLVGGHSVGGASNNCLKTTTGHAGDPAFEWYAEGFRCCKNPDSRYGDVSEPADASELVSR